MLVTEELVLKRFQKHKRAFLNQLEKNSFETALVHANYACSLARRFPILEDFVDLEIEAGLLKLGNKVVNLSEKETEKKGILFFSSQTVDNGALTEQYLDYLIDRGEDYLYVTTDNQASQRGKRILSKTKENVTIASEGVAQIKDLAGVIKDYNPSEIWIHLAPDHVEGYAALSLFKKMTGLYIVHNSHSFWLGTDLVEKFTEFQMGGVYSSSRFRKIKESSLGLVPFYPIGVGEQKSEESKWLYTPRVTDGKTIALVSGNRLKILYPGAEGLLDALTQSLNSIPKLSIWIATIGGQEEIKEYFKKQELLDRVKFLGYQKDLDKVLEQVDCLIDTFPFGGGLMRQIAIRNFKPVFRVSTQKLKGIYGTKEVYLSGDDFDSLNVKSFVTQLNRFSKEGLTKGQIGILKKLYYSFPDKKSFQENMDRFRDGNLGYEINDIEGFSWDRKELLDLYLQFENMFNRRFFIEEVRQLKSRISIEGIFMAALQIPRVVLSKLR
ncbi:hypothetical protein KFE94_03120 [bacterium SCSIO 12643]|nr:hypothetical protein KFE94_03120 [bacterium SCSIO 12643]